MAKYLTLSGLQKFWNGVKAKLDKKVDIVEGKGLSTNDLTNELKAQYDIAEKNVIVGVSINGAAVSVDEATRTVDLDVPTTDDIAENFYTKTVMDEKVSELNTAIAAAASGKITIEIVDAVPTAESAQANILYFVPREGDDTANDVYDQYMLINGAIEAVGSTEVELSGYAKAEDIVIITDEEIDAIFGEEATE